MAFLTRATLDVDTRRSTVAYVFFFSGCALSWKTKLHSFVTTSTNHSELVASAMAAREAKYLWTLFNALGDQPKAHLFFKGSVDLFSDSQGVVAVSANPVLSAATKHVEIADFYVRELVERGLITVTYVKTDYMVADVLTKPLAKVKFYRFIGVILGLLRDDGTPTVAGLSSDFPSFPAPKLVPATSRRVGQRPEGEEPPRTKARTRVMAECPPGNL